MAKWLVKSGLLLILFLVLPGCAYQAVIGAGVEKVEQANDAILATAEATICSKHLPLRAYEARYGARWNDLVQFCRWNQTPPAPVQ